MTEDFDKTKTGSIEVSEGDGKIVAEAKNKPKKRGRKPKVKDFAFLDKITFGFDEDKFKESLKKNLSNKGIKNSTDAQKNIQHLRAALTRTLNEFGLDPNKLLISMRKAEQE